MDLQDLAAYLEFTAPADMSALQVRNLTRIRVAHGRPISVFGYEAIRAVLVAHDLSTERYLG